MYLGADGFVTDDAPVGHVGIFPGCHMASLTVAADLSM